MRPSRILVALSIALLALLTVVLQPGSTDVRANAGTRGIELEREAAESPEEVTPTERSRTEVAFADSDHGRGHGDAPARRSRPSPVGSRPSERTGVLQATIENREPVGVVTLHEREGVMRGWSKEAPWVDGVARFEDVVVGRRFELEAEVDGARYGAKGLGPTESGETVEVVLRPIADTRVRFRPLDAEGAVLHRRVKAIAGRRRYRCEPVENDGLVAALPPTATKSTGTTPLKLVVWRGLSENAAPYASIELPASSIGEHVDLGDVTFEPPPVLCRGTVLDSDGEPLHRADVRVVRTTPDGSIVVRDDGAHVFGDLLTSEVSTGRDGSFTMRGIGDPTDRGRHRLYLVVESRDETRKHPPVPFAVGEKGIVIRLVESGSVEFEIRSLDATQRQSLEAELWSTESGEREWATLKSTTRFANLLPGPWDLKILQGSVLVAEIKGLDVPPGAECEDARLDTIDLLIGQRVERRSFDIETSDGGVPSRVQLLTKVGPSWETVADFESRRTVTVALADSTRAALCAYGYGAVDVTELESGATVRFERLRDVTFQLTGALSSTDGLFARFERIDVDLPLQTGVYFDDTGRAEVDLPIPSRCRLTVTQDLDDTWIRRTAVFDVTSSEDVIEVSFDD